MTNAKPGWPPRVWIFRYEDDGREYLEADRAPFGQKTEDQYLSLQEHAALLAEAEAAKAAAVREALEAVKREAMLRRKAVQITMAQDSEERAGRESAYSNIIEWIEGRQA